MACAGCQQNQQNQNNSMVTSSADTLPNGKPVPIYMRGIKGIYNSLTGNNYAKSEVISQRRDICSICDKKVSGICSECKCIILLKTTQETEKCPLGKW